ncbi:hypothetical protein SAMN04487945_1441 [Halobacterium jilantaiense]|uniref:Uncharacterized protein n=1 Tax=Halobacterium jilantaiense TaxID=355548 RepID=A0A1I0P709_9EURY|nr:hypothetical protein SAMN04487945_1441 [Halobacterium jilantaiense]
MKPDSSGVIKGVYGCDDCEFGGEAGNAVGIAAQHAEANPSHGVWAEQVTAMEWSSSDDA